MSVRVMSAVFESRILGPVERLVMLALADHADDAGRCYPSNARLQDRTGLSERAVRANIRKLEDAGFLAIAMNAGQGGANVYIVRPDGAPNAPRHEMPPGTPRPTPRHMVPVGGAPDAPKPSRTINEPSEEYSLALPVPKQPDRFEEFWDQFPHRNGAKKGKAEAEKAWTKAIKARASPDQIIAGAMRYAGDRQVIEGYAKNPATWLNAKGWDDEIERAGDQRRAGPPRGESGTVAAFAAIAARRSAGAGRD